MSVKVAFNGCSQRFFDKLPESIRGTIAALQSGIESSVLRRFPGAIATSGFRCSCENRRVGGVAHSFHLLGLARDYVGIPFDSACEIAGLKVIPEPEKGVHHFEVAL